LCACSKTPKPKYQHALYGESLKSKITVPFTAEKPRNLQHYMNRGKSLKPCLSLKRSTVYAAKNNYAKVTEFGIPKD
jgi:hypothetical protein